MHRSRTVTLSAALVAASLALGAAGPASAAPNAGANVVPTDKNGMNNARAYEKVEEGERQPRPR